MSGNVIREMREAAARSLALSQTGSEAGWEAAQPAADEALIAALRAYQASQELMLSGAGAVAARIRNQAQDDAAR